MMPWLPIVSAGRPAPKAGQCHRALCAFRGGTASAMSVTTGVVASGAVVITVRGDVEYDLARAVRTAVDAALSRHRPALIFVDLGLVTFIASEGIGALLGSRRSAERNGTRLLLR